MRAAFETAEVRIKVRNPFKDTTMRREFDASVRAYNMKHANLFRKDGTQANGSSFASFFWKGFNGTNFGAGFTDRASRQMIGYAYYRAGQLIRKATA